ncbi:MAG: HNH endonuclease [Hyphomicrobiaceae bacterium]|nr:MAG: HNH endonuclease [Hyphomicrobiaceae bacterium]
MERQRKPERRANSYRRGYATKRWRDYRERYIVDHPFCCVCERKGREVPTYAVDHIKRVTGPQDPLFWEPTNHQPLCKTCHSRKTAKYDGGFGHKRKEYDENS